MEGHEFNLQAQWIFNMAPKKRKEDFKSGFGSFLATEERKSCGRPHEAFCSDASVTPGLDSSR